MKGLYNGLPVVVVSSDVSGDYAVVAYNLNDLHDRKEHAFYRYLDSAKLGSLSWVCRAVKLSEVDLDNRIEEQIESWRDKSKSHKRRAREKRDEATICDVQALMAITFVQCLERLRGKR